MGRSEQREHIFKMIFGAEFSDQAAMEEQFELYLDNLVDVSDKIKEHMLTKARDVVDHLEEIDRLINEHTTGWKTGRMNKVDLTIIRLAVYEMRWDEEVPEKVAINEAVELGKRFSSEEAPAFINAVLAKLVKAE